jgi:hypothetical protein
MALASISQGSVATSGDYQRCMDAMIAFVQSMPFGERRMNDGTFAVTGWNDFECS